MKVDTLGFLANNLRGYEPTSILREQLQNADDASHKQGRSGELQLRFLSDRLVVRNPSIFTDEDWERLLQPNSRGKFLDADQTGEFGVGFWGALHLADAPIVTSGRLRVVLHPLETTEETVDHHDGTKVEFVYRRQPTDLSEELDAGLVTADVEASMADTFVHQMAELLLFTRAIEVIMIELPDGSIRRATRTVQTLGGGVERLGVDVSGALEESCKYLIVRSELPDPPTGRHGRITVALPLSENHRARPGRAFFMFPTETDSGLSISVDAHFRATDDRRSLENSGPHGVWNDRIFDEAGRAVGEALESVLDPTIHGLDIEDAISWFALSGSHLPDIKRRAKLFATKLDTEARLRAVIPDRSGDLCRGSDLVNLPAEIEPVLADAVGNTALPANRRTTAAVYERWGLGTWGPVEVASWLCEHLSDVPTPRANAPEYIKQAKNALALLKFCQGQERALQGIALLLGTDDSYHPIGSDLARPDDDHQHLVTGLARPLVDPEFRRTWAARYAPHTTAHWFRDALIESADELVARQVPIRNVGAASKQQHVSETIAIVTRAKGGLAGVPLALDEERLLQFFDDQTVVGLPDANRRQAERLARRLGLRPLHKSIDDDATSRAGNRFGVSLINELIPHVEDWDPATDSRLLVEVLASVASEGATSQVLIDQLRSHRIWKGSDGTAHSLDELRLPARDRITRSSRALISEDLLGGTDPASPIYSTLHGLLRVDVLDTTEEVVLACEDPPSGIDEQRQLLTDLADCNRLSKTQNARLQRSAFVICGDGHLRRPDDMLLTTGRLPLGLGDRCIDDTVGQDRRVREQLKRLGARELPRPADLLDIATKIARLPIPDDPGRDPSRVLWDHLLWTYEKYATSTLSELAAVPWLLAPPGPQRRKPKDCYDPQLSFAASLFPVPVGVGTPAQAFRDALKMRATLETSDCVKLGQSAAEDGVTLSQQFFKYINRRCERGDADVRRLAKLRELPIIPLTTGLTKPEALVSRERAEIWGHLRDLVPDQFVSDYSNLLDAWGISSTDSVGWVDHRDVLDELAARSEFDGRDRALARERVKSLATIDLDEAQLETLRRRGLLLTSLGLRPVAETLRGDLPPATLLRLQARVPVAEETVDISDFLDRLDVRSLRSVVTLEPIAVGETSDSHWPDVLRNHAANVLRFLKSSGATLDQELLEGWPPIVRGVAGLTVRASLDGEVLDEWDADAHLTDQSGEMVLYVSASDLDGRSVVDAISSEFGVDRGRKTLLLSVLDSPTPQQGTEVLDWENIPPLTERESAYLHQHQETTVAFVEPVPDVGAGVLPDDIAVGEEPGVQTEEKAPTGALDGERPGGEGDNSFPVEKPGARVAADLGDGDQAQEVNDFETASPLQSPRGITDIAALEDHGIRVVRDLDSEPVDDDYRPTPPTGDDAPPRDEVRVCLSFFDVANGLIPIRTRELNWLTTGAPLREVEIFGQAVAAQTAGPKHIRLEDGASVFHSRQVVPGTVMRAHPSSLGKLEVEVRAELHRIDGVWMLDFDEKGQLTRLKQDDVELQWETDDLFYRAERRLEDIRALMADGGKSAVQLIIEVFLARPGEGLTVDEIWGLVAISRLFANATISQTLSVQTGLFQHRDGLWYKVGDDLRRTRSSRSTGAPDTASRRPRVSEAVKLARKLAQLLVDVDADVLVKVVQLLGIEELLRDSDFSQSCARYMETGDPAVLEALERDIRADPGRAALAIQQLESLPTASLAKQRSLITVVVDEGNAAAVDRARHLVRRIDAIEGLGEANPLEAADQLLLAYADGAVSDTQLWEGVSRVWSARRLADPLEAPSEWVEHVALNEDLHRRAMRKSSPPEFVVDVRKNTIGWLSAQLPGDIYDLADVQQLRVVLDLLVGKPDEVLLDGLHQLGVLADNAPGGEGDAALAYALLIAQAKQAGVRSAIVQRSESRLAALNGNIPSQAARRFGARWLNLARLAGDALRQVGMTE